jgi:hypothetical protein
MHQTENFSHSRLLFREHLIAHFSGIQKDIFDPANFEILYLVINAGIKLTLAIPYKTDVRRNADPLMLEENKCYFCNPTTNNACIYEFSRFSNMLVRATKNKALQYAKNCGPEPMLEHFIDMLEFAFLVRSHPLIIVVNLPGSGASAPHHFHTQIFPSVININGTIQNNSISTLFENLRLSSETLSSPQVGVKIKEITAPMWGLQIIFDDNIFSPTQIAFSIYSAIHQTRYLSQLYLSYNLYIRSEEPGVVSVIFREARKERPFATPALLDRISDTIGSENAEKLNQSNNSQWRWGWMECIGGLPARNSLFNKRKIYNSQFWQAIYNLMAVNEKYREGIRHQVVASLSK